MARAAPERRTKAAGDGRIYLCRSTLKIALGCRAGPLRSTRIVSNYAAFAPECRRSESICNIRCTPDRLAGMELDQDDLACPAGPVRSHAVTPARFLTS